MGLTEADTAFGDAVLVYDGEDMTFLLENGASPTIPNRAGSTLLDLVWEKCHWPS